MRIKLLPVLWLLTVAMPSQAETLIQLRNRIDTWLANRWPTVTNKQQNYFANHTNYWQGLRSHIVIPIHTSSVAGDAPADNLDSHPTDQAGTWHDAIPEFDSEVFAAAVEFRVYDGPLGKGYIATVWVTYNNVTYMRSKGYGPETWHDVAWSVYIEDG